VGHPAAVSLKALAQAVLARTAAKPNLEQRLPSPDSPAYSIIRTCRRYGVLLQIDPMTGELTVGREGAKADDPTQPWPTLIMALEAHLDDVAALLLAGWTLKADIPRQPAA
jgi:hypothetical protein